MKHTIIDINEMSDSKEIYGQRPNPFLAGFIYSVLLLVVVGIAYCCFCRIEIVASASGIVRPNEDVSTVSSLVSGRVTDIYYIDGQYVQEGELLLEIETTELEISLESYEKSLSDEEGRLAMLEKFVTGVQSDTNPFDSDINSEEYSYYLQYMDYELEQKNNQSTYDYDSINAQINLVSANQKVTNLQNQLDGLNAYKASVESDSNQASGYPEYEAMYLLYTYDIEALEIDYNNQREKIWLDTTDSSNEDSREYYNNIISNYEYLVTSVEKGSSAFPSGNNSNAKLLWNDYISNLQEYERQYESAVESYNYYQNLDATSSNASLSLATARVQMESAAAAIDTYKNKMLSEYKQSLSDYKVRRDEVSNTIYGTQSKSAQLSILEQSYNSSLVQKYYQTMTQINSNIQTVQTELSTARSSQRLYEIASELYSSKLDGDGQPISISMAKIQMLSSLLNQQESIRTEIDELTSQIEQTRTQIAQAQIRAQKSGLINVSSQIAKGDTVSSGVSLATIIPARGSEFKMQIYANNSDIASIEVGDEVRYDFAALPSSQYGSASGYVTSISADVVTSDGEYSGYYLIEATIEDTTFTDRDGNEGSVAIGMQAEVRIVTQEKTIIRYLLEKINLF